jgi:thiamine pyrophosphate-dependent acetolactate synthase large subunit-like protein
MAQSSPEGNVQAAAAPVFELDRREALPALVGRHEDFLIIAGLAGTSRDVAALTKNASNSYPMGGAMGGACMMGLGLALAQRDRRVLVVTGDGELLMNVGALATIGVMNPPNLSIVCVDNGHYGETGNQKSHTSLGADLEKMAQGAGIKLTRTVQHKSDIAPGARFLREGNGTVFVLLRVNTGNPPDYKRIWDPVANRNQFRAGLLGE